MKNLIYNFFQTKHSNTNRLQCTKLHAVVPYDFLHGPILSHISYNGPQKGHNAVQIHFLKINDIADIIVSAK